MNDQHKTKQQLVVEKEALLRRVAALENVDITERKRAEEALVEAHDELERQVKDRTAELAKANEQLQIEVEKRKHVEEELRANEKRLRLTLDAISDGFWERDMETDSLFFSPRHCALLGYAPEEMPKTHKEWEQYVHPDDLDPALQKIVEYIDGRIAVFELEFRARRKSGEWLWMLGRGKVIRCESNGRPTRMVGVNIDITERKNSEEALRQSHDELQAIYEGTVSGLLIADIESKRFVRANPAICRMLGYSKEELLSLSVMDIHPAEDLPAVMEAFKAKAEGRIDFVEDIPTLRKDGSVFYADIGSKVIVYGGRPSAIGFFRDITERTQAQEALRREHRNLKHLLQSSDHERQTIAYEIHDGLTQYLAGAIMQFDIYNHLRETKPKQAANAFDAGLTMLRQSHFEARRLIADVRPPVLDESGVVEAIAHLVNEQSRLKGPDIEHRSRVNFDRLPPTLENAIYRIAQEGLANACQHSKSEKVRVSLLQRGDRVRIKIRDWGVGFDTKAIEENCYGLEGIRQRTKLLGGKCRIRSTMGEGTRITVELPVVVREADE